MNNTELLNRLNFLLDNHEGLNAQQRTEMDKLRVEADARGLDYGDAPARGHDMPIEDEPCITEAELSEMLSDWADEEFDQFVGYYFRQIKADGTTNLTRAQWRELADDF